MNDFGPQLLGPGMSSLADFPLLYKFIDAHDRLSVQVHPSDADAHENGWGRFGKTECWYIVHAEPRAQIAVGFRKGVSKDDVSDAVRDISLNDLLEFHDIAAGDVFFIPAGTVHAICGNTILYEVQQTSDVTFRLYDWGRLDKTGKSRPLHIRESLQVLDTRWHSSYDIPAVPVETLHNGARIMRIACRYFALEEYDFYGPGSITLPTRQSFSAMVVLDGSAEVSGTKLARGQSVLFPAAMGAVEIGVGSGARFLISWVPDLTSDIIIPLNKLGIGSAAIASLGGNAESNDLLALL